MTVDDLNDNTSQLKDMRLILYFLSLVTWERPKIIPELLIIYTTIKIINYFH